MAFQLADLRRVLRESAGEGEGVDLDGEILDTAFEELGYDSVALMEAAARISRDYGAPIEDDALTPETTPRELLDLLNGG